MFQADAVNVAKRVLTQLAPAQPAAAQLRSPGLLLAKLCICIAGSIEPTRPVLSVLNVYGLESWR